MRPLQALNLAMIRADALGDVDAVNRLYAMRGNPEAIGRLLLGLSSAEEGETQKFADIAGAYSCVMLPLVGDEADAVIALGQRVAMRDLHEKGLEYDPHVTALYGLHEDTLPAVETVAKGFGAIPVALGRVSVFPATPQKPYDVLKVGVVSPDLVKLNRALRQLPHTDTYAGAAFSPHVTIGYLKPGRGLAYAKRFGNVGKSFAVQCLVYSDAMKRQSAIPLGATASFAEWTQGTSPATGETGWISSGGQFRKEKPTGGEEDAPGSGSHHEKAAALADTVSDSLANDPEVKANPGLIAKIKDMALTAGAKAIMAVDRIQNHWTGKAVAELVDAYFDSPTDMKKLGYNPGNSAQTASPKVMDPVSNMIQDAVGFGMSGHLVAKIAAEVLSRGFLFLRNKYKGAPKAMADEQATGSVEELAQVLADLFNEVNKAVGLDGQNDAATIAEAIRPLLESLPVKFADWKPGQSATGESGWVSSGGQFRHDKPASADEKPADERSAVHVNGASLGLPERVDPASIPAVGAALGNAWKNGGPKERAAVLEWTKNVKMDPRLEPVFASNLAKWADVPHKPGENLAQHVERAKRKADFLGDKPAPGETPQTFAERHYPELKEVKNFNVQGASSQLAKESVHDAYEMRDTLKVLAGQGTSFHVGDTGVPDLDAMQDLKGVAPRGWPPGSTWDQVTGCYNRDGKKVVAGGLPTGCVSVFAHEAGHGIGAQNGLDDAADTIEWHKKLHDKLPPYLQQGGPGAEAGRQELVAEAIAVYFRAGPSGLAKWNGVGPEFATWLDGKLKAVK